MASTVVILLGAPGAGKGTQAQRLSERLSLPHVSTGDLFRENLARDTGLGRRAKTFMESGRLVPDELVLDMLFDRVDQDDCRDGYVLDGFPRTLAQARALDERLGDDVSVVAVAIEVPDREVVRRMAGRLTCKACGNVQHRDSAPPAREGECDRCGGELVQREDDRPEVVEERLRVYREQTAPLVEHYRRRDVLRRVDGEQTPDQVFAELEDAVAGKESRRG